MLYELAHKIQEKTPFVWDAVEGLNSALFVLRCGRKLKKVSAILSRHNGEYIYRQATLDDVDALTHFFACQKQEDFHFFNPHRFDASTIRKLIKRRSHLFFVVCDKDGQIVGYYFLRCFFIGRCFLGKIVDYDHRGLGIGSQMCLSAMEVANALRIHMYETIAKDNTPSLKCTTNVLSIRVVEELENGYIYIEDFIK